ncbi:MAG: DUF4276 family protein [Planctomycetes bacterium]|nr:DUF4276 family protein [Planctomycetota bacterium]
MTPAELTARVCELTVEVVLATREFESWFLASAEALAGSRGLPTDLAAPEQPEAIRGAKEWLTRHMARGRAYQEVVDQPALTARLDLDLARRRSDSFDVCVRRVARLIEAVRPKA